MDVERAASESHTNRQVESSYRTDCGARPDEHGLHHHGDLAAFILATELMVANPQTAIVIDHVPACAAPVDLARPEGWSGRGERCAATKWLGKTGFLLLQSAQGALVTQGRA